MKKVDRLVGRVRDSISWGMRERHEWFVNYLRPRAGPAGIRMEASKPQQAESPAPKGQARGSSKSAASALNRATALRKDQTTFSDPRAKRLRAQVKKQRRLVEAERMRKARRLIRQVDQLTEFRGLSRLPNIEDCDRAMREAVADFLVSDYAAELMKSPPEVLPARWVVGALSWKLELMAHMVVRLVERGDEYAIVALARVVGPMVKAMNRVARTQPESLRGVPHQVPHWPVLKSLHSEFDDDHEGLLELLEVGKGLPFTLGREARWKANDAVGRWVLYLVTQIEALHDSLLLDSDADWFKAAVGLDELSAENWEQWWSIMQGMLRDEYVDVIEIPVLNDTVTSRTDRKSPGRIRARIYKNLKERLRSLAGLNKV